MSPYKIEAGTAQHLGNRPQQNDRVALFTAPQAPGYVLAILADGGADAIGADQVLLTGRQLFDDFRPGDAPGVARLQELLRGIALEAHQVMRMHPIAAGVEPHSTLAIMLLSPLGVAVWAHVGDARVYCFSNQDCVARSNDAEYIAHLVEHDKVPLEAARKHRRSRLLGNMLGNSFKSPFVTVGSRADLQAGDAFLLCSDGLWQLFTDQELAAAVARNAPRQAAERLINKAIERAGGKGDNCSMAIVKLVAPPREVQSYTVRKMGRAI